MRRARAAVAAAPSAHDARTAPGVCVSSFWSMMWLQWRMSPVWNVRVCMRGRARKLFSPPEITPTMRLAAALRRTPAIRYTRPQSISPVLSTRLQVPEAPGRGWPAFVSVLIRELRSCRCMRRAEAQSK